MHKFSHMKHKIS